MERPTETEVEERLVAEEFMEAVRTRLTPLEQITLHLRLDQELGDTDIAERMQMTKQAVHLRMEKIRAKLDGVF